LSIGVASVTQPWQRQNSITALQLFYSLFFHDLFIMSETIGYRQKLYQKYFSTQVAQQTQNLDLQIPAEIKQLHADLNHILPDNKNSRILDIGCGYGNLLLYLQQQGYTHLEGIDLSPEQVATAHSIGLKNVQQADAFSYLQQLAPNATYDLICMFDVIEHLHKTELLQLLELIRSRLSEKGKAIFRTPNMDAPFTSIYAFGDFTHETLLNSRSATQLMRSAGFQMVNVVPSPIVGQSRLKTFWQNCLFIGISYLVKIVLFATARSSQGVLLTPNMIIVAQR
jgi:2-polyprenyl-3-methyl-5-hydroxy-6-metoxy-1,4-benzoquinol methylase